MEITEIPLPKLRWLLEGPFPDAPLHDFEGQLVKMAACETEHDCFYYNAWIEDQQVCGVLLKWHGREGLQAVLKAIAEASVRLDVSMTDRVRSTADFYGIGPE